jgi:hypothetical protein
MVIFMRWREKGEQESCAYGAEDDVAHNGAEDEFAQKTATAL